MLTPEQTAILRAAIGRIIPPDDFPGGWEAGAGDYLLRQLQRDLQPLAELYSAGLDSLDAEARSMAGANFAALGQEAQDALLGAIERGDVTTVWPVDPAMFFRYLVEHAMEGFYSDPGNGGNSGAVSWRMIGFEVKG
jgi:hypothetical protein